MNERIKEFAKQAGFYKYGDDFEDIIEKFAELIVKECMEWCDAHATIDGTAQQVRNSIKNHFGIDR